MTDDGADAGAALLEEALWQIEEAKKANLSTQKAMNFIKLSKDASGYGNVKLSQGLLQKARETLYGDMVERQKASVEAATDVLVKLRTQRSIKDSMDRFQKGDLKGAYDLLKAPVPGGEEGESGACRSADARAYSARR